MARPIKPHPIRYCQHRRIAHAGFVLLIGLLLSGLAAIVHAFTVAGDGVRDSCDLSASQQPAPAANQQMDVRTLEQGKPIERALSGGQIHSYQTTLAAGQYLHVVVEQRGIDVVVVLFGPDGKKLVEVDSPNGTLGPEPIRIVSEAVGSYRLEVRSLEKRAAAGRYEARIAELRAALPQDQTRIAAQKTFAEGMQLQAQLLPVARREAIKKFEAALPLFQAVGDHRGAADALQAIGFTHSLLGEKQKALAYYKQAVPLRQADGDRRGEAEMLNNIGVIQWSLGEKGKALENYTQALPLLREVGDRRVEAAALNNLGALYASVGENRKALEYCEQALPALRALGERRGEASALINLGALSTSLSEHQKALAYYGQALPLLRDLGDRRLEATTLNNLGISCNALGEGRQSLDYYSQALHLWRQLGDRRMEARTLNNIGKTYGSLSEYQQAINYFSQARAYWRDLDDRGGVGSALQNIGGVYGLLGDHQRALDYLNQALLLFRALGDRRGEAFTLTNIGSVYAYLGESRQALSHLGQALPLLRAIGDREEEAVTLHNIGVVHGKLKEYQRALDHYHQALSLFQAAGSRYGQARMLTSLGSAYASLGEQQKALDHLNQALPLNRAVSDRLGEAHTLSWVARVERDRDNHGEARAQIEAALDIIESLRARVAGQELRAAYFASAQENYELYINLLMRLHRQNPFAGHDRAALQANERARARNLLDLLSEARADIRQGVDPILLEQERSLQQRLSAKVERQIRLLSGKHTPAQAAEVAKEIEALRTQFQETEAQIRATSKRYSALTQPVTASLQEIQQQAIDTDTLLLEYALGEERSYLWAVSPASIASFELPGRSAIEEMARRTLDLLTARDRQVERETVAQRAARIAQADAAYPAAAEALSQVLLAPVASQLGTKRLVIVSDGALQYIPFTALLKPSAGDKQTAASPPKSGSASNSRRATTGYRPLMLDHEIVSLPSISTLMVLRRELAGRSSASKIAAVLADPVFEPTDLRVKRSENVEQKTTDSQTAVTRDAPLAQFSIAQALNGVGLINAGQPIPRLANSQREAAVIKMLAPEHLRKLSLGFEASYATATNPELGNYRIVHFATHGLLNSKQPELSGILLSLVDEQGRPQENGLLRLGEIYNLKLPADLVVLSACQTALGKEIKGEGLVGLTRGFMYAGAARVIASLWKVDDEATAELMKRFYEGMLGAQRLRPAEALRRAQIEMWRKKEWRAPYYWGAFTLQGEWK